MSTHYSQFMTCISQSYSFISNLYQNTQNQACIIHTKPRKPSHIALSRPASRSGWRVSLRRAPIRLGEGSKHGAVAPAGSRLGETPLALARCLLAQKHSGSPRRPFVGKYIGEPLLISPRRGKLAWASLTDFATVPHSNQHSSYSKQYHRSCHTLIVTYFHENHRIPSKLPSKHRT